MMSDVLKGLRPTHPGEILRGDVVPALGRPKAEVARALGVSRHTFYELLNERQAVRPRMAHRLGKLCGNGPDIWLQTQLAYDLAVTAEAMQVELERIPTLQAA